MRNVVTDNVDPYVIAQVTLLHQSPGDFGDFIKGYEKLKTYIKEKGNSIHDRLFLERGTFPGMHYPTLPDGQLFDWLLENYPLYKGQLISWFDLLKMHQNDCPFTLWEMKELILLFNIQNLYFTRENKYNLKPSLIW